MQELLPRKYLEIGEYACRQGEPGEAAFVIERGAVEVLGAGDTVLAVINEGEIFGEVALLDCLPRTASVRAIRPTTLLRIERVHVQELLKRSDPVIRHLLTVLLERFRATHPGAVTAAPLLAEDARQARQTLTLTQDLAHAIAHGGLELAYQPLICLRQRQLLGFEALIRWQHPLFGAIAPIRLIDLAERTGLIHGLSQWVLGQALADWRQLRQFCATESQSGPFISVNLSAPDFADPTLVDRVEALLRATAVPAAELHLELTESTLIEDSVQVGALLERLAGLGVRVALDDFGTGYAGLDCLKSLPVSCLKIDQAFVRELPDSHRSRQIVASAIALARSLGLSTIGEGIETPELANTLQALGCDIGQGYHFARPLPLAGVADWVATFQASVAG